MWTPVFLGAGDWWRAVWGPRRRREADRLGKRGEEVARRYLTRLGYVIVARGDRDRMGEIDLVAVDGRTVVFVEVKTRRSHDKGTPADAVDLRKRRKITRVALTFLKRHDLLEYPARFDVVAITWPARGKPEIQHIKGAFESTERWQFYG